jgi:hypothetical protein
MSSLTTIQCKRCFDKGYVYVGDSTGEDNDADLCDCITGQKEGYWNSLRVEDAMEESVCAKLPYCGTGLYASNHDGDCPKFQDNSF